MKVKVHYENEELDKLVKDEETRELIVQTLILYPVTWEIIRDMICQGLSGYQIKAMCGIWYIKGQPISIAWRNTKTVLGVIR